MTRYEYQRLRRVRRSLMGLPQSYMLALQLFDKVLSEAEDGFCLEDNYQDEMERNQGEAR